MASTRESGGTAVTGSGHTSDIDRLRIAESLPDGHIATILGISRRQVNRLAGTRSDSARRWAERAVKEAAAAAPSVQPGTPQVYVPTQPADPPAAPPVEHDVLIQTPGVWGALRQHGWPVPDGDLRDTVCGTFIPEPRMCAEFDTTTLDGVITRVREGGALRGKLTEECVRHAYDPDSPSRRGARNGAVNRARFIAHESGLVLTKNGDPREVYFTRAGVKGIYVIGHIDGHLVWHIGRGPRSYFDTQRTFDELYASTGEYEVQVHL